MPKTHEIIIHERAIFSLLNTANGIREQNIAPNAE
jgi:hypothetical protein